MVTQPASDFMINVPMSMARRIFAEMTQQNSGDDYFRMKVSIEAGERDEKRRQDTLKCMAELDERRKAEEAARPFSERHNEDECCDEFNRLRCLYNFQWQPQTDLWHFGGLIVHAYDGTWVGTSTTKTARDCLKVVEHGIKEGILSEYFVGPLNDRQEKDEE